MAISQLPPIELSDAMAKIWAITPPGPSDLFNSTEFIELNQICSKIYSNAKSKETLKFALHTALSALGIPFKQSVSDPDLIISSIDAAHQLHDAFLRKLSKRTYLCPLDCADKMPTLTFGPNLVKKLSIREIEEIINLNKLKRINRHWSCNVEELAKYTWLIVTEEILLPEDPAERSVPFFFGKIETDFSAIDPYPQKFPRSVERALFSLIIIPWEDLTKESDFDWRGFKVPWIYQIDEDIFQNARKPPSIEKLTWDLHFYECDNGETQEVVVPVCYPQKESSEMLIRLINEESWNKQKLARSSELIGEPAEYFLLRAFVSDGIDEFISHITSIEASLGLTADHYKKLNGISREKYRTGATMRVSIRLAFLLQKEEAYHEFMTIFKYRSEYIHGRTIEKIPGDIRVKARHFARSTISALMEKSTETIRSREEFLEELFYNGHHRWPHLGRK